MKQIKMPLHAPSVAYHLDGIFIASPFSLQSDFC